MHEVVRRQAVKDASVGREFWVVSRIDGEAIGDRVSAARAHARFLARIGAQARAHVAAPASIAAAELVRPPDGSFAVARAQVLPLTARDLAEARVAAHAALLYEVVGGAGRAVEQLEREAGRSHGRLRPEYVLIDHSEGWGRWRVLLTGLASEPELSIDRARARLGDLRGLGELIHELVLHVPFNELRGYPLQDGAAWKRLGKHAGAWRDLANRLLDPRARPNAISIAEVNTQIAALKAKPRSPVPAIVASGVLAVALIGGGAAAAVALAPERGPAEQILLAEFNMADFTRWCEEADAWFLRFAVRDLGEQRGAFERDPALIAEVVEPLESSMGRRVLDPKEATGIQARRRTQLPGLLSVQQQEDQVLGGRIVQALEVIDGVRASIDSWSTRGELKSVAAAWRDERGWDLQADELERVADSVDVSAGSPAPEINSVVETAVRVRELVAQLDRFDARLATIEAASEPTDDGDPADPVLAAAPAFLASVVGTRAAAGGGDPLAALSNGLDAADPLAGELAAFADDGWASVDREVFVEEGLVPQRVTAGEAVTAELLRAWLVESREPQYAALDAADDPRLGWPAPAALARAESEASALQSDFAELADEAFASEAAGELDARERLVSVRGDVDRLERLRWKRRTRERIDAGVDELGAAVRAVERRVASVSAELRVDPEVYIADLRARDAVTAGAVAPIDAAWRVRRDELINDYRMTGEFPPLRRRAEALVGFLVALERAVSVEVPLPEVPVRWDAAAMRRSIVGHRARAASAALDRADWTDGRYGDGDEFAAELASIAAGERDWARSAAEAARVYAEAERLLALGYLTTEAPADGESPAVVVEPWSGRLDELALVAPLAGVTGLLDAVASAEASGDRAGLLALASDPGAVPVPVARAAYRRLGALDGWPSTPGELESDADARRRLDAALSLVNDAERETVLRAELAGLGQRRWLRAMNAATTDTSVERVMALADEHAVDIAGLPPRARFNAEVYAVRSGADLAKEEELLRADVASYARSLRQLASAVPGGVTEVGWLDELTELGTPPPDDEPALDPAAVGPGRAGWEPGPIERIEFITYHWPSVDEPEQTIEFALLEPAPGNNLPGPTYVATTELSVAQTELVVSEANVGDGGWESLLNRTVWVQLLGAINAQVPPPAQEWSGPRAWGWRPSPDPSRSGLVVNDTWLRTHAQLGPLDLARSSAPAYPPAIGPQDGSGVIGEGQPRPSGDMPMHQVSHWAAGEIASLAGCRLPTPDEWRAAFALYESQTPAESWNLRDLTYALQQEYTARVEDGIPGVPLFSYPDDGALLPKGTAEGADAEVRPMDDGVLWFDEVTPGRGARMRHLVGNVAEFVEWESGAGGPPQRGVMGASALSPPDLDWAAVVPIRLSSRRRGFSDVGIRLAFSAEGKIRRTVNQELERLLEDPPYALAPN